MGKAAMDVASPVIGQVVDDGEARPAVRAVDERIPVAAIVGVEQLAHAVLARGKLGRDERRLFYGIIVGKADLEAVEVLQGHFLDVDLLYAATRPERLSESSMMNSSTSLLSPSA